MQLIKKYIYHPIKNLIAKCYVLILQNIFGLTVIGITGSSGKTTTKEMLAGILRLAGKTVWSFDNIDPVFNIPSTILKCTPYTKYLILEMGVEYVNEMDFYLWLVKPKIGVITNIYPTHTLYFGDENGVLKEKSKLVKNTKIAVLNSDNSFLQKLKSSLKAKEYWFKNGKNAIETNKNIATKIAEILKVPSGLIKKGLDDYKNPRHRLQIIKHKSGAVIFDDTYNSNPEALLASLSYFNELAGQHRKIAVIGDMLELGKLEVPEHNRVGRAIKESNFEKVFGVGKLVKYITPNLYQNSLAILPEVKKYLKPNVYIFMKGSRSIDLDKLVDAII